MNVLPTFLRPRRAVHAAQLLVAFLFAFASAMPMLAQADAKANTQATPQITTVFPTLP